MYFLPFYRPHKIRLDQRSRWRVPFGSCLFMMIFYVVTGLNSVLHGQDYKPLLDNTNEWHVTNCYFGCLTDVYFTDGDTLVEGNNYKVLDGFHYISRSFLLREEVSNQRVYLRKLSGNGIGQEYLLYDFSLQEGDSFEMFNPITPFPENAGNFVVDSIRLRLLEDGLAYRHYYFSPAPTNNVSDNTCVWVEGVGSLSIINAPSGYPDINGAGQLSCFFKEGDLFYTNLDSIAGCSPILGNRPPLLALKPQLVVDSEQQLIQLHSGVAFDAIAVYSLTGQIIAEQRISRTTDYVGSLNLAKGMYFLSVANTANGQKSILPFVW